jgi:1-phosphofructokinase family hexose kinase
MIYTLTLNPAVDRELTIKEFQYNKVLRAKNGLVDFGGKGFNVSRMLRSLEQASIAVGFVGGKLGEILRDGLEGLGIETDFIWVDGEARTNISIVTESREQYLKVNEPGPTISQGSQDALFEKIKGITKDGDLWVFAGSLPPGVPVDFYAKLAVMVQQKGARVIIDTSLDALVSACQAGVFLVKPNEAEAEELTGLTINNQDDAVKAAFAIQELGVPTVILSLGKDGAIMIDEDQAWRVASPKITERNPIGAGDSMVGGLVYGLCKGIAPIEALRWGIACGAATASLSGTEVGSLQMVQELLPKVEPVKL